jgi:hypothetical protein
MSAFPPIATKLLTSREVAGYVVALRCLKEGGNNSISAQNIRNQVIDATIASYATYFDGFLSNDNRAQEVYGTTCDLLKIYHRDTQLFVRQPSAGAIAHA